MRFLLLNQTFHPDVMATGQYLADVALALVERGHEVTVVTSRRAYDHPEQQFPKAETWRGIRILRAGSTGFGKSAKWRRAADFASFLFTCALRTLFLPRHDVVVALTSPPLISVLGAVVSLLRGSRFVYWVMDFNPDEAVAAGWLRAGSLAARIFDALSRFSLRRANKIIALDRFMRDRIRAKGIAPEKIVVVPPWSHDQHVRFDAGGRKRFRQAHGLEGKFVVMYSGNHSPCHPLDTLLQAAERLAHDEDVVFCFVGGGSEWRAIRDRGRWSVDGGQSSVQEVGPAVPCAPNPHLVGRAVPCAPFPNLKCLPYQPLSELAGSLSAADLHVVVMGEPFVGLVHPCKIYNILAVGAPVLYIGPAPSHVTEILASSASNARSSHGDVDRVVEIIQRGRAENGHLDRAAITSLARQYSREALLPRMIGALEEVK